LIFDFKTSTINYIFNTFQKKVINIKFYTDQKRNRSKYLTITLNISRYYLFLFSANLIYFIELFILI